MLQAIVNGGGYDTTHIGKSGSSQLLMVSAFRWGVGTDCDSLGIKEEIKVTSSHCRMVLDVLSLLLGVASDVDRGFRLCRDVVLELGPRNWLSALGTS